MQTPVIVVHGATESDWRDVVAYLSGKPSSARLQILATLQSPTVRRSETAWNIYPRLSTDNHKASV